jgi:hypothetical protein
MNQMPSFEDAWIAVAKDRDGEAVSQKLHPLLRAVYIQVLAETESLAEIKKSLRELLEFLSGEGRTNANCWAVDLFFGTSAGWELDWAEKGLPDEFHDVLAKMGEALHDTVRAKHTAEEYDCLPEQLLAQVNRIRTDPAS